MVTMEQNKITPHIHCAYTHLHTFFIVPTPQSPYRFSTLTQSKIQSTLSKWHLFMVVETNLTIVHKYEHKHYVCHSVDTHCTLTEPAGLCVPCRSFYFWL